MRDAQSPSPVPDQHPASPHQTREVRKTTARRKPAGRIPYCAKKVNIVNDIIRIAEFTSNRRRFCCAGWTGFALLPSAANRFRDLASPVNLSAREFVLEDERSSRSHQEEVSSNEPLWKSRRRWQEDHEQEKQWRENLCRLP
jgi:hypothetical protein